MQFELSRKKGVHIIWKMFVLCRYCNQWVVTPCCWYPSKDKADPYGRRGRNVIPMPVQRQANVVNVGLTLTRHCDEIAFLLIVWASAGGLGGFWWRRLLRSVVKAWTHSTPDANWKNILTNTRCLTNVVLMLSQRRRSYTNIKTALGKYSVFAGMPAIHAVN